MGAKITVKEYTQLEGHKQGVYALLNLRGSSVIVSAGGDGAVVKWDLAGIQPQVPVTGKLHAQLPEPIFCMMQGAVAAVNNPAHLSMLGGFVFFSHQIGSFMGVWLGGYLYDKTGSYDIVWYISIALGLFAAFVNLPVKENPIERQPKMATA